MALTAERVQMSLMRLQAVRPPVFGSETHRFTLNAPLPEEAVVAFETLYKVRLPADYRHFITNIGNGGAGPFYGVFPLGMVDDGFGLKPWEEENTGIVGTLANPFLWEDEWNDLTGKPSDDPLNLNDPEFESKFEQFDARYWGSSIMDGAIPICHTGCALRIWLVLTGKQSGRLWYDKRADLGGLSPMTLEDGTPILFSTWYEEWLATALAEAQLSS